MTIGDGFPLFYGERRTAASVDLEQLIVIVVFCVLAVAFLLILPGIRGRARIYWFIRVLLSLLIGCLIVVVNFQTHWEVGHVETQTEYRVADGSTIKARIGLGVSLHGFNITLQGTPRNQLNEMIDYNERFTWQSGNIESDYQQALQRGLPVPILQLAETFGRNSACAKVFQYAQAGGYASALIWVAFVCWTLSNLLFVIVLRYGGAALFMTGFFLVMALISFGCTRLAPVCQTRLGLENVSLHTTFGYSFWLTLANAVLCLLLGSLVIAAHFVAPHKLEEFFSNEEDEMEDLDEKKHNLVEYAYLNEAFTNNALDPSKADITVAVTIPEAINTQL
ncbi:dual oxidase maturation factor 2-like [Petromyzon marinus]|uniref:Dual oxidase maturation factor 2-like n=1 Tax=Petromyzon marinus TaxID=7757 RepID=A0AAJ7SR65_PETMA|nr:dual oxidase maturation factor 2-like [Petromyzon marinus]